MKRLIVLLGATIVFVSLPLLEASGEGQIVHYRGPDGSISTESVANAGVMKDRAQTQGYVTLWLTFDFPLNVNFAEMTPDEISAQEASVSAGLDIILDPLIQRNKVWHPATGKFVRGAGCVVRATVAGLNQLLHDERILQITALDD